MTKIINDAGEEVIEVGAQGSAAWCKVKFPVLIEKLNLLFVSCDFNGQPKMAYEVIRWVLNDNSVTAGFFKGIIWNTMFKDLLMDKNIQIKKFENTCSFDPTK